MHGGTAVGPGPASVAVAVGRRRATKIYRNSEATISADDVREFLQYGRVHGRSKRQSHRSSAERVTVDQSVTRIMRRFGGWTVAWNRTLCVVGLVQSRWRGWNADGISKLVQRQRYTPARTGY